MAGANLPRILALDGNPIGFDLHQPESLGDARTCLAEMWGVSRHSVKLVSDEGAVLWEDGSLLGSMTGDITAIRLSRTPWVLEPFVFQGGYEASHEHPDKDFLEWSDVDNDAGSGLWGAFTHIKATPRDLQSWEEFAAQQDYVEEFEDAGQTDDLGSTRPIDVLWSLAFWNGFMYCTFGELQPDDDATAVETARSKLAEQVRIGGGNVEEWIRNTEKSFRMLLQLVEKRGTVGEALIPDAFAPITESVGRASNDEVKFACFATAKYNFFMKYIHPG